MYYTIIVSCVSHTCLVCPLLWILNGEASTLATLNLSYPMPGLEQLKFKANTQLYCAF